MSTLVDGFKDFRENLSERIRSPFLGTFLIVWCTRHWKLLGFAFFENKGGSMWDRIDCIELYLGRQNNVDLFWSPILITLGILLLYTILNSLGLGIKLLYTEYISPFIQQQLNNEKVVIRSKYESEKRRSAALRRSLDEEKQITSKAETEVEAMRKLISKMGENSIRTELITDIRALFKPDQKWIFMRGDGNENSSRELLEPKDGGFQVGDGFYRIENLRISENSNIVTFEKIMSDNRVFKNVLTMHPNKERLSGFEESEAVTYFLRKTRAFEILEAKYYHSTNFIDVRERIQYLVDHGILQFAVTNKMMGGDPAYKEQKNLSISFKEVGAIQPKTLTYVENELVSF